MPAPLLQFGQDPEYEVLAQQLGSTGLDGIVAVGATVGTLTFGSRDGTEVVESEGADEVGVIVGRDVIGRVGAGNVGSIVGGAVAGGAVNDDEQPDTPLLKKTPTPSDGGGPPHTKEVKEWRL